MNAQPAPTAARQIVWPSVVTVISAAILIGAEVFGAALDRKSTRLNSSH